MIDCGIAFVSIALLAAVIAVVVVAGLEASRNSARKQNEIWARAAAALGGKLEPGNWRRAPVLSCRLAGRPAEIRLVASDGESSGRTSVTVDIRGVSPGALKIFQEGFGDSLAKMFGAQDVRVGDREFDGLYVVKSSPETLAHRVFSPERRKSLVALVRKFGRKWANTVFDVSRQSLTILVPVCLHEEGSVVDVARDAATFAEAVLGVPVPEGEVLWAGESAGPGGLCQVCGTEMTSRVVLCAKCRTPHHEDCWKYVGECSTYACRERNFTR